MKKTRSINIVDSCSIQKALEKDLDLIWIHTNYESFDYQETLETLYHCGIESFPYLKRELQLLNKQQTQPKFKKLIQWIKSILKN